MMEAALEASLNYLSPGLMLDFNSKTERWNSREAQQSLYII